MIVLNFCMSRWHWSKPKHTKTQMHKNMCLLHWATQNSKYTFLCICTFVHLCFCVRVHLGIQNKCVLPTCKICTILKFGYILYKSISHHFGTDRMVLVCLEMVLTKFTIFGYFWQAKIVFPAEIECFGAFLKFEQIFVSKTQIRICAYTKMCIWYKKNVYLLFWVCSIDTINIYIFPFLKAFRQRYTEILPKLSDWILYLLRYAFLYCWRNTCNITPTWRVGNRMSSIRWM